MPHVVCAPLACCIFALFICCFVSQSHLSSRCLSLSLQAVTDTMLEELKSCFMEAYDDNQDGKIDIREVCASLSACRCQLTTVLNLATHVVCAICPPLSLPIYSSAVCRSWHSNRGSPSNCFLNDAAVSIFQFSFCFFILLNNLFGHFRHFCHFGRKSFAAKV